MRVPSPPVRARYTLLPYIQIALVEPWAGLQDGDALVRGYRLALQEGPATALDRAEQCRTKNRVRYSPHGFRPKRQLHDLRRCSGNGGQLHRLAAPSPSVVWPRSSPESGSMAGSLLFLPLSASSLPRSSAATRSASPLWAN